MTRHRRGLTTLLVLVCLVVMAVLPVMVARHSQGSRARATVAHALATAEVLGAARSALAEAWWDLEHQAITPGSDGFARLRSRRRGAASGSIPVPRTVRELVERPGGAALQVEAAGVEVHFAPPALAGPVFGEVTTRATLSATVRHRLTGVGRTLSEARDVRVSLIALPPPFDAFPVLVVDAARLIPPLANAWMEESVAGIEAIRALPGHARAAGQVGPASAFAPLAGLPPPPDIGSRISDPLHRFPDTYSLASIAGRVPDLGSLDLTAKLSTARERVVRATAAASLAGEAGAVDRLLELAHAHRALLDTVKSYQDTWVEYTGEAASGLARHLRFLAPGTWRERATYRFEGPGAARRFLETLDAFEREPRARGLHGIAYVDDPDAPVELTSRSLRGRLVLVVKGEVSIRDVRVVDAASDRLVVQACGGLEVSGHVEAALVSLGTPRIQPGASITGQLVVAQAHAPLAGGLEAAPWRHDSRFTGEQDPGYFHATFAPWAAVRELAAR